MKDMTVRERTALMSDAQLTQAIEEIRGNPQRGQRRRLRLGELMALTALYREQERRGVPS